MFVSVKWVCSSLTWSCTFWTFCLYSLIFFFFLPLLVIPPSPFPSYFMYKLPSPMLSFSPPPPLDLPHSHQTSHIKSKSDFPSFHLFPPLSRPLPPSSLSLSCSFFPSVWKIKSISGSFVHPPAHLASSGCCGNRVYTYWWRREWDAERWGSGGIDGAGVRRGVIREKNNKRETKMKAGESEEGKKEENWTGSASFIHKFLCIKVQLHGNLVKNIHFNLCKSVLNLLFKAWFFKHLISLNCLF